MSAARAQVVVLGPGAVGRALLTQLVSNARTQERLAVCGVVDRSGFVFSRDGLSRRDVLDLCEHKASGGTVATSGRGRCTSAIDALSVIGDARLGRPIVVDATAADTGRVLHAALAYGFDAVLANKIPLSAPQCEVDALHAAADEHRRTVLYEATVGAGLPVIDTIRKLIDAGDRVVSVEGCPSGTLGFLFGELHRGRRFSDALRDAIAHGYTEPDPRIDLSGLDVARKALILARCIGFRGDLSEVAVDNLVPASLRDVAREEFIARSSELDDAFAERVEAARAEARVLRYRARVTATSVSVGIAEVSAADPLSALHGTDNQFSFVTERYSERPLVITGPGAGAGVTASGIHNDLLKLA
jgi:aspartokinase/homoserine dehydrogenase 1